MQLLSPPCQPCTLTTGELHDTGRVHASTAQQLLSEVSHLRATKQRQVKRQCPKKPTPAAPAPRAAPARPIRGAAAPSARRQRHRLSAEPRGVVPVGSLALQSDGWHHEVLQLLPVLVLTYHELSLAALFPPRLADSTADLLRPQHPYFLTGCMVPPAMMTARHSSTTVAKWTAGFSKRNLRLL